MDVFFLALQFIQLLRRTNNLKNYLHNSLH